MSHSDEIGFDLADGVAVLELRRPSKRNAVTATMWESMLTHLRSAASDSTVRALVVRGVGPSFCAGADLGAVKAADGSTAQPYRELAVAAIEAIAAFPAPTVARIQGACVGAGCSVVLACDVRFVASDASFAVPAARHGIVYDQRSISRLVTLVGPSKAARMLYAASTVRAEEAVRWGLAEDGDPDLDAHITEFVAAVTDGDAATIRITRGLLRTTANAI